MSSPNPRPTSNPPADDEETAPPAKSAEDRKAATALASLDARDEASAASQGDVDQAAVSAAMKTLGGEATKVGVPVRAKNVKVDQADVALLVDQLELPKAKATELLKAHEGDAVKAMRAFVQVRQ